MKRALVPFLLAGALSVAAVAPAGAQTENVQRGGAAGLVAAVVQVATGDISVEIANNSLNNLLRNADIDVLNNVLNNSPILSNNDVDVDIRIANVLTDNTVIVEVLDVGGTTIGTIEVSPSL